MPIHGYPGNIITANPTAPTVSAASGVWTTEQQMQYQTAGNWPMAATQISRSLRFNSADSAYLNRTPASAGNRKTFTQSLWFKRGKLSTNQFVGLTVAGSANYGLFLDTSDILNVYIYFTGSVWQGQLITTQVFRDPSAWYHFVLSVDTTQATSSNRIKVYVNGSQITAFSTANYPNQNQDTNFNSTSAHFIGQIASGYYTDGYLTEVNFIDGQALTPSNFGFYDSNTGIWTPRQYTGTYGTNGFYLNFSDNSNTTAATLGKDYSGNGNNWTPNNFSVTAGAGNDSLVDTPTSYGSDTGVGGEVRGNYCTMNPLDRNASGTMSEGNLKWTAGAAQVCTRGTFAIPASGKWYMECLVGTASSPTVGISFGLAASTVALDTSSGATSLYQLYASTNRQINLNNSTTGSVSGGFSANDILQIAVDVDNQKMWLGVNNTWYDSTFTGNGNPVAGTNATSTTSMVGLFPFSNCYQNNATWNFGQRPFAYTAPSGFKALCTQNLPTPTIGATSTTQANDYFNAVLYTGNGSTQSITGVGFQPDLLWIKSRSNAENNIVSDSVRGATGGTYYRLFTDLTNAESTNSANGVSSLNSDGFTVASGSLVGASGYTYVAWNWKANGAGSSNTAGTITSTVSANTTAGFSIVTYTGNGSTGTVGHGLGVAPSMIIVKVRSTTNDWGVGHASIGWNQAGLLNLTNSFGASSYFNSTAPTSTVFSVGNSAVTNTNSATYVAYCFAAVAGYSAFGSYTGNGSSDGPFVYTGFRPRWILIKNASAAEPWNLVDTSRDPYNVMANYLQPNSSGAEGSITFLDGLSNGFKLRSSAAAFNGSGNTMIYACFAENPFKYSLAR